MADSGITSAEKIELEQLRQEKKDWQREKEHLTLQLQEETTEKARLLQEINLLQLKNAQLVEDHTRDVLAIKSKETQLIRAHSDIESARLQISQLEIDSERTRSRPLSLNTSSQRSSVYSRLASPTSPAQTHIPSYESPRRSQAYPQQHFSNNSQDAVMSGAEELDMEINEKSQKSPVQSTNHRPLSYQEPRNSQFGGPTRFSNIRNSYHAGLSDPSAGIPSYGGRRTLDESSSFSSGTPSGNDSRGSNWKRAAEVTVQLKARIEAMKARQNQNRAPLPDRQ